MNISEIKDKVAISDLLGKLGFQQKKRSGAEIFYLSPIRESDTDASFCVNDRKAQWYDHGSAQGGNVIDLGLLIWNTSNVKTVVSKINDLYLGNLDLSFSLSKQKNEVTAVKKEKYRIIKINNLGKNPSITNYLLSRGIGISEASDLKEVYYWIKDNFDKEKRYFGVGWENESGGWDIRNPYFKGCLGKKDISVISGISKKVNVFEGMFDFQAAIKEDESRISDYAIILNSAALANKGIAKIKSMGIEDVNLFFDNDQTGKKTAEKFTEAFPKANDRSNLYLGFKDYNEKLMANNLKPWQCLEDVGKNKSLTM